MAIHSEVKKDPFLDWIRFTLPYNPDSFAWIDEVFGGRVPLNRGLLSYSCAELLACGGCCAYSPERPENRVLVELSARALWVLDGRYRTANHDASGKTADFFIKCFELGARFTRVDVALDDYDSRLFVGRTWDAMQAGDWVTRFRSYSRIQSVDRYDATRNGDTVYIGSRSSEAFVRVYDKAAESGDLSGHWVRLEFEFKGPRADEVAGRIARETINLRSLIYYYIDFKHRMDGVKTPKNWPTADWWAEFIAPMGKDRLYFPQYEKGLEEIEAWLDGQVSGALSLFLRARGIEAFQELLDRGDEKFLKNKRYQRLEKEYHERLIRNAESGPGLVGANV